MPSKLNEMVSKKSHTKLSKNERNILTNPITHKDQLMDREEAIATSAYYRAEKRGFSNNDTDMVQDWLEAETEVDSALELDDLNDAGFQFMIDEPE
ncbi:Protein of unknown function [Nitrosomonas ureae]|uniref:DUF2934 domain-containing protein n=1 Tax=Nitrosomonas ureae TaxID=44577 RepID=A0A285BUT9_9PROT|nr:DUF2934 domain-containing protein [Nitrosomonas ureae]SNX58855.1 Protein of unknown function [Nitrosomonas ureae]